MTKDKYVISKAKRYPYYILMFAILIWFVAMEIFGTDERMIDMAADSLIYSIQIILGVTFVSTFITFINV